MRKPQKQMYYDMVSKPRRCWEALMEIQNSTNPLTKAELIDLKARCNKRGDTTMANCVQAYINGWDK